MNSAERAQRVEQIRRLRAAAKLHRGGRRRRIPRMQHPNAVALAYRADLKLILSLAKHALSRELPLEDFRAWEIAAGTYRADAKPSDVHARVERAASQFFRAFTNERLRSTAEKFALRVNSKNREEWGRQVRAGLGVDVVQAEPWLEPKIEAFAADNVALIKSMAQAYFSDVEKTVARSVREGVRPEEIADELEERYGVAESKAALIARDQVGKLFGELTRERQTDLGVEKAVWRTAGDERVRESHAEMEGEVFRWDDPPIVDGEPAIPGQPILCRCTGEPDFSDLLE